ncbi:late nodulin [Medicago truncatula]|uniref:Late nodulin n=2 Tax=Medicago truncatula TaxID=3880 RepID=G7KVY6_MEDTR|nr:late nodulin [Medicago truncatula]
MIEIIKFVYIMIFFISIFFVVSESLFIPECNRTEDCPNVCLYPKVSLCIWWYCTCVTVK